MHAIQWGEGQVYPAYVLKAGDTVAFTWEEAAAASVCTVLSRSAPWILPSTPAGSWRALGWDEEGKETHTVVCAHPAHSRSAIASHAVVCHSGAPSLYNGF
jgi:hypothetical protein